VTEVGRLNVRLNMDTREFGQNIQTASQRLDNFGRRAGRFGDTMTRRVTLPMAAVGTAIGGLMIKTGQWADELLDTSAILGVSTDRLQEWEGMAARAGIESDAFSSAMETMNRRAARGSATFVEGIELMNMSLEEFQALEPEKQMDQILDAMVEMEKKDRIAFANKLNIPELLPVVDELIESGKDASEAWEEFDYLEREDLERADEFRQMWDEIKRLFGLIAMDIGIQLIDLFREIFDLDSESLRDDIMELGDRLGEWIDDLGELIDEHGELIWKVGLVVAAIGPASKLVSAIIGLKGLLSGPVGLIILVGAAAEAFSRWAVAALEAEDASEWLIELARFFGPITRFQEMINQAREDIEWLTQRFNDLRDAIGDAMERLRDFFTLSGDGHGGFTGMTGLDIPTFHSGGTFHAPTAGGEGLALLKDQERVIPAGTMQSAGGGDVYMTIHQEIADKETADYAATEISRRLQTRGLGGAYR